MTNVLPALTPMIRPWPTLRALSWPDRLVFVLGAVGWIHLIDAASFHAQRNASPIEHTLQFLLALAAGPALAWFYLRRSNVAKAAIASTVGMGLLFTGIAIHIVGTIKDGFGSGDVTGLPIAVAGLALLLMGIGKFEAAIPRWRYRLATIPLVVPLALYVLLPGAMIVFATHAPRYEINDMDLGAPYEDIEFQTADGLTLRGWYIPSKNGAAVAVMHGASGARIRPYLHIRMLQENGFGVLAYDTRGHGESDGTTNAFGWGAHEDAIAALAYMESRDDVEPGRVGLLGLSMGAEIALEMATKNHSAAAIVADGAGVRSINEFESLGAGWKSWPAWPAIALQSYGTGLVEGTMPPPALAGDLDKIETPIFYIASAQVGEEWKLNDKWFAKTNATKDYWKVDASHTGGMKTHPHEYERRVVAWFETHLLQEAR